MIPELEYVDHLNEHHRSVRRYGLWVRLTALAKAAGKGPKSLLRTYYGFGYNRYTCYHDFQCVGTVFGRKSAWAVELEGALQCDPRNIWVTESWAKAVLYLLHFGYKLENDPLFQAVDQGGAP